MSNEIRGKLTIETLSLGCLREATAALDSHRAFGRTFTTLASSLQEMAEQGPANTIIAQPATRRKPNRGLTFFT